MVTRFTLDANILINLKRSYPREFFGSLLDAMESAASSGEICVCDTIHRELKQGGDELFDWVKDTPGFLCAAPAEEIAIAKEISKAFPEWVRDKKNYGDPFLIAHAKFNGKTVVTQEKLRGAGFSPKTLGCQTWQRNIVWNVWTSLPSFVAKDGTSDDNQRSERPNVAFFCYVPPV